MRSGNVVVVGLGLISYVIAVFVSWNWRQLPLKFPSSLSADSEWRGRLRQSIRTVGGVFSAGAIAGVLVLGVVGRLVMRILGATSGNAQGQLTDAGETVGEITFGGSFAFLVFVGLGGGIFSAAGYLFIRTWLPAKAGSAGLIFGILVTGTLGVSDALAPKNVDFTILGPLWLAILLIVGTGFLFATTFTAIAARLDQFAQTTGRGRGLLYPALIFGAIPPVGATMVAQVALRTFGGNKLLAVVHGTASRTIGFIVVATGTAVTAFLVISAAGDILTA